MGRNGERMDKEQIVHLQGMGINRENRGKYQTRGESEKRNKQGKSNHPGREIT
jgi:hypothetical protein